MAANKRLPIKWIRDKAKAAYRKGLRCYICGSNSELELHHLTSLTELFDRWVILKGYKVDSDDDVLAIREQFIAEHKEAIYTDVFTLCNKHHVRLHSIFGQKPSLESVENQRNWIESQRVTDGAVGATFAEFY